MADIEVNPTANSLQFAAPPLMRRHWGWILGLGIFNVIIGICAFAAPLVSTLALNYALAIIFIVSGVVNLLQAFQLRKLMGTGWRLFQGVLSLLVGILMFLYPLAGMFGMILALSFYFFANAATEGALAISMRPMRGWGLGIASSILSFLIAIVILFTFPLSALWLPGALLGAQFVISGLAKIICALTAKNSPSLLSTTATSTSPQHPDLAGA